MAVTRRPYAENTSVSPDRTLLEIKALISKYGGDQFGFKEFDSGSVIVFRMSARTIRYPVRFPDPKERRFQQDGNGRSRTSQQAREAYDKEVRRRWRVAAFGLKAKLELVADGFADFESEFLAYIVLPSGETVGELAAPAIEAAYREGIMPASGVLLLPPARSS